MPAEGSDIPDDARRVRSQLLPDKLGTVLPGTTLTPHDLLEFATLRGAAACGLEDKALTVGKQADIVLIRRNDLNLAPFNDPAGSLVAAGHAGNVDTVLIAGKFSNRTESSSGSTSAMSSGAHAIQDGGCWRS